jgi:hypothetical protein
MAVVFGGNSGSLPTTIGCDFTKGSFCATVARLDVTHGNIQNFLTWQEAGYNQFNGCSWFATKINQILSMSPTNNTVVQARRKSKIDFWNCMTEGCGCSSSLPAIVYGCMDGGSAPDSYINNRGTWDFSLLNNTTSSGIVNQPDGTQLPGVQYGSAYPGIAASNYMHWATVDDGSCVYASELPYTREGCMDSTPHDPVVQGTATGYPDINGHGTAAEYDCTLGGAIPMFLTTPLIGYQDPCGSGPGTPCNGLGNSTNPSNTGYVSKNYDPCANFSCGVPPFPPNFGPIPRYSSDYNIHYTEWEDGFGFGTHVPRPFGNTDCCDYTVPPVISNPDITYDFRLCGSQFQMGGIRFASDDSITGLGNPPTGATGHPIEKIGGQYLKIFWPRWDVVGNTQFQSLGDFAFHLGLPSSLNNPPIPLTSINIKIYDVYKNMIGDWDYIWDCIPIYQTNPLYWCGVSGCPVGPSGIQCWAKPGRLILVQENFSINPGQIVDLNPYNGSMPHPSFPNSPPAILAHQNPAWWTQPNPAANIPTPPRGYVRIDSGIEGTTVERPLNLIAPTNNVYTRVPSTHWITPRGNTANLTTHWTGQDLNADLNTNIWNSGTTIPSNSWTLPHSCHDCGGGGMSIKYHWLEPGPNDPTPGDFFYNNPGLPPVASSVHPTWMPSCSVTPLRGNGSENMKLPPISYNFDCSAEVVLNTKITYSKDENQEVTITSDRIENTNLT